MPLSLTSKNRPTNNIDKDSDSQHSNTTGTCYNTRRNGASTIIEEAQDFNDALEGRKYLEQHLLLCPAGEPALHQSLATCLHQISSLPNTTKPVINAICTVALLLEEMEDTQIYTVVKEAVNIQINKVTTDIQKLIEDAMDKLNNQFKQVEAKIASLKPLTQTMFDNQPIHSHASTTLMLSQTNPIPNTYAAALINPPHANPKLAAHKGIKARQFAISGIKNSSHSSLNPTQLKFLLNNIITELGIPTGKIYTVTIAHDDSTIIEANSDIATNWLSNEANQKKICEKLGTNIKFYPRSYKVLVYNVLNDMDPNNLQHLLEICETNNIDSDPIKILSVKWVKVIANHNSNQRSAHLYITITNTEVANRAITDGLYICHKKCQVKKSKCEPTICLKCQGWNHLAKDCIEPVRATAVGI